MPYNTTNIRDHFKQQGEWAELLFMARAAELGLSIVRPWGDSSPYDVAIERHGHVLRVQIKSTRCRHSAGAYKCHIDSNGVPYREGMLDFIAAYVIPVKVWYIIPFDATQRKPRYPQPAQCSADAVVTRGARNARVSPGVPPGAPSLSRRSWSRQGGEFDFQGSNNVPETHSPRVLQYQSEILLAPHRPKSKYARFKEAWHLLREDPAANACPRCGSHADIRKLNEHDSDDNCDDVNPIRRAKNRDADQSLGFRRRPTTKSRERLFSTRPACPLKPGETCPILTK